MKEKSIESAKPLHAEFLQDLRNIFSKYNIPLSSDYFETTEPETLSACHNDILNIICTKLKDRDTITKVYLANMLHRPSIDDMYSSETNLHLNNLVITYLSNFCPCFFTISNGEIKYTNDEEFVLPSTSKYLDTTNNMKYINSKLKKRKLSDELELIITQDGTTYFAPNDHRSLAYWLLTKNIDINHSIRIEAYREYSSFDLGSLDTRLNKSATTKPEQLKISDNQAKSLRNIYATLMVNWKNITPIEKSLQLSNGLGLDKDSYDDNNEISRQNLKTLGYALDDIGFKPNKYIKEIGFNSSVHERYTCME